MASGQKMSGGLHAWMAAKRPRSSPPRPRATSAFHDVAPKEYAYSAMKLSLLPPGAYGWYLYSSTPSMTS